MLLRLRDKAFHSLAVILAYLPTLSLEDRFQRRRMLSDPANRSSKQLLERGIGGFVAKALHHALHLIIGRPEIPQFLDVDVFEGAGRWHSHIHSMLLCK